MSSVPVAIAARVYGKDPAWVRAGIISGWLPIGIATRNGAQVNRMDDMSSKKGRINYYISPKKLYEHTGFRYDLYESIDSYAKSSDPFDDPTGEAALERIDILSREKHLL